MPAGYFNGLPTGEYTTMDDLTFWESEIPATVATVEEIDHFDARGMQRVYGRGDHFGRHHSFNMDIWMARNGRLLMRYWSRYCDIDRRSFEITGVDLGGIPERQVTSPYEESWIP